MENISDRLSKIADYENISIRKFEQIIGCSNGVLSKAINKRTDISSTWLTKIIEHFPKYDGNWLLTGMGHMLRSTPAPEKPLPNSVLHEFLDQIKNLAIENSQLKIDIALIKQSKNYEIAPELRVVSEPKK